MAFPFCGFRRTLLPVKMPQSYYHDLQKIIDCTREEANSIYDRFRLLAPTGHLSLSKFQECLGLLGAIGKLLTGRMFMAFDLDGNGTLDFVEFASALLIMMNGTEDKKLELSFRILHPPKFNRSLNCTSRDATSHSSHLGDAEENMLLDEFIELVHDITTSRSLLLCRDPVYHNEEYIKVVFDKCASMGPNNVRSISKEDFIRAVTNSNEFLDILGVSVSRCAIEAVSRSYDMRRSPLFKDLNRSYINRSNANRNLNSYMSMKTNLKWVGNDCSDTDKRGLSIHFGHERWNDVILMMIGLQFAGQHIYNEPDTPITNEDFMTKFGFNISYQSSVPFINIHNIVCTSSLNKRVQKIKSREYTESIIKRFCSCPAETSLLLDDPVDFRHYSFVSDYRADFHDISTMNSIFDGQETLDVKGTKPMRRSSQHVSSEDLTSTHPFGLPQLFSMDTGVSVIFKEYAPMVFRRIRMISQLTKDEYIESIRPEQLIGNMVLGNLSTMSELVSEGKSGALFYYTINGRLILKTITKQCAKFVRSWLKSYYEHLQRHPNSFLTRFYGLFSIQPSTGKTKTYFIVMNNIFYSKVAIHRRYDLKGSWVGRSTVQTHESDHTVALKDCDFVKFGDYIDINRGEKILILNSIKRDVDFLKNSKILDYSLLLGIHYRELSVDPVDWDNINLRNCFIDREHKRIYYLGIIDFLTCWNFTKRAEHILRSIQTLDHSGISCVNPKLYAERFVNTIMKVLDFKNE